MDSQAFATFFQDVINNSKSGLELKETFGFDFYAVSVEPGKKYDRIVVRTGGDVGCGGSAHFFITKDGVILGVSSWTTPNFKRCFGNLNTVNEWKWDRYPSEPESLKGLSSLVPKAERLR